MQSVETTTAKKGKNDKGSKDTSAAPPTSDPLQDPLSISAASDPLSTALLDPLSAASIEANSFGAKKEVACLSSYTTQLLTDNMC